MTPSPRAKRSIAHDVETAGAVRLEVRVAGWGFDFLLDADPTMGELRSLAETVATVAGCGLDAALHAVVSALEAPVAGDWEAAA
jgi:hypothetical protein